MEDEGSVSAYEIYSSGLVEVLLQLLTPSCLEQNDDLAELQKCRIEIFVKCFKVDLYNIIFIILKLIKFYFIK